MNSLRLANELGCTSVSLPAVSAGVYGWEARDVARIGIAAAHAFTISKDETDLRTSDRTCEPTDAPSPSDEEDGATVEPWSSSASSCSINVFWMSSRRKSISVGQNNFCTQRRNTPSAHVPLRRRGSWPAVPFSAAAPFHSTSV